MDLKIGPELQVFSSYPKAGEQCFIKYVVEQFLIFWFGEKNIGYVVLHEYFRNLKKKSKSKRP